METAIIENFKTYGITIQLPAEGPVRDFYERYCRLQKKYNDEKREAFSKVILGIDPKR